MHTIVLNDQHLNVIMELLSNAPYRVSAPIIQEIAKQLQIGQTPTAPMEARVSGNGQ